MAGDWTVDASGHFVDWTQPPYTEPGSSIHHLVLEGEDYHNISGSEMQQRIHEYMKLARRQLRGG